MHRLWARARDRGAAAVEFALVVPILIVILLGVVDFGLQLNSQAVTANAAREGARTGSLGGSQAEVITAAKSATVSLLNTSGTNPTVKVTCRLPTNAVCPSGLDTSRQAGGTVVVTVSYVYKWLSPAILGLPASITVSKTSEMRIE